MLERLHGGDAVELAHNHGFNQAQLFAWQDRFLEEGEAALKTGRRQIDSERERQVQELERKPGQITAQNEMLKKTDALIRQRG